MPTKKAETKPEPIIEKLEISDDRFYKIGEEYYPSVTTILNAYPKGYGLTSWYMDNGHDTTRIKNLAKAKGSIVHKSIERLTNGEVLSFDNFEEDEWKCLMAFCAFWEEYKPEVISSETTVYSNIYKFAGTIDSVIKIGDKFITIDYKTSKNLWAEYDIQLSAYEKARIEMKLPASNELWIVQLGNTTKKGYTIHEVKDWQEKFVQGFLPTKTLWEQTNPNAKPFVKEIPTTLKLTY